MKRKIYNRLLEWKEKDHGNTAVMIEGARRIGKSYIAEEFARNEYSSYMLIDKCLQRQGISFISSPNMMTIQKTEWE